MPPDRTSRLLSAAHWIASSRERWISILRGRGAAGVGGGGAGSTIGGWTEVPHREVGGLFRGFPGRRSRTVEVPITRRRGALLGEEALADALEVVVGVELDRHRALPLPLADLDPGADRL